MPCIPDCGTGTRVTIAGIRQIRDELGQERRVERAAHAPWGSGRGESAVCP